jgi:predicted ArsR family transcriptional regulator
VKTDGTPGDSTTVHRALADPRRAAIVDALRESPLDAVELGRRVGLHANTVRFHLTLLRDAGLVTSRPAATGRGRPRILYSLEPSATHDSAEEHRLLATMLAGAVGDVPDGEERAEQAGRAWGRYLVARPQPLAPLGAAQAQEALVDLLAQQGFEPESAPDEIRMHRCPFHELAETHADVVCGVHRGLIDGGLEELGDDLELDGLDVFPEPDVCVARLRSR